MGSTLHIGQLNVRVPGKNVETGRAMADGVAKSLARNVRPHMQYQLGAMNVRVQAVAGTSEAEMSHAIAEAIGKAIQRGGKAATDR
ncbi:MAG: hypothetical protein RBS57_20240 [Desulforhabdus sp.]|nr:hypothetical protein [Desulforhabdus sp.]